MSNKKLIIMSTISIIAVIVTTFGITFAYFSTSQTQKEVNNVNVACFGLNFNDTNAKVISLPNAYPISNGKGLNLDPYTFSVSNTCDTTSSYKIILNVINTSSEALLPYINISLDGQTVINLASIVNELPANYTKEANVSHAYVIHEGTLSGQAQIDTYDLRIWIDKSAPNSAQGQRFEAKLSVYSEAQ